MIPNGEGWHYIAVKKLSALLIGITSKIKVVFIVWLVFILLEQKTNLNHIKKICEFEDFCSVEMPYEDTNILRFNQYQIKHHL